MKTKKKENIIIIAILVVMLIAIIGVSYAAFNFSQQGNTPNKITTGSITMTYEESDNTISIGNALPTTDTTGMARLKEGEYFDFTVSSEITGEVNINYEISAKEVEEGTIDGSNIKLYLTKLNEDGTEEQLMTPETYNEETTSNKFTGRPANEMSLYTSSMNSSESNDYRLRMYVTEEYNPQGDGGNLTFTVQVNVYGKAGDKIPVTAGPVNEVLMSNIPEDNQYDDGTDTFITGEDPNNYVWYSGKLWRAVSVNNEAKTTKLVTQWNITSTTYNASGSNAFEGSYMESWLNDTTVDGFLGNLREPDKFIVMDAKWNATENMFSGKPPSESDGGIIVEDAIGLLNTYEYATSYRGISFRDGYLNNGLNWWTLTPSGTNNVLNVDHNGSSGNSSTVTGGGVRPSINLKSSVKVADGNGTIDNPYRLEGDNDTNLSGTYLKDRFSGEYIKFGTGENNLYRIVSHENGIGTKIVSAEPLKSSGEFIESAFGSNGTFSSENTIGTFLNGDYLNSYVDSSYSSMIEDSTTWYLGAIRSGTSYKLAKYTDETGNTLTSSTTDAKVGLLRYGELMSGQFERYGVKGGTSNTGLTTDYWLLTPYNTSYLYYISPGGGSSRTTLSRSYSIRPSLNLKSNVVITSGDGTKNNPFQIELSN